MKKITNYKSEVQRLQIENSLLKDEIKRLTSLVNLKIENSTIIIVGGDVHGNIAGRDIIKVKDSAYVSRSKNIAIDDVLNKTKAA